MKKQNIITFIISMCIGYLAISFVIWDINASNWSLALRAIYAFIFPTIIIARIYIYNLEEYK